MKSTLFTLLAIVLIQYYSPAQSTKKSFTVQINEFTVVRDSANNRLSYPVVQKLLASGNYTVDPIRDSKGNPTGEYRIRRLKAEDAGKREVILRTPGIESLPKPKVGDTLPDFVCVDINGDTVRRSDFAGKIIVINFWFSVCKPCLYEIPYINDMAVEFFNRKDIVFLAPNWEKTSTIRKFLEIQPMEYRVLPEATSLIDALNIRAYPTHLIVDKNGVIRYSYAGGLPGIEDVLRRDIKALLAKEDKPE
ncbi:MAG: TlpA family protein disulfide reductase [Chitinophagales bacterium]|nr:TlpA family protein disulfide reductase [Chitinophagales bacterium]MDW8418749.1 TlpA disulfide reductase family protein [Chitinophagales bacterium]